MRTHRKPFRGLLFFLTSLSMFASNRALAQCPPCYIDQTPMAGHGQVSSTDTRRVIIVRIDSSLNDPSTGKTNAVAWNAVAFAVNQWNTATDTGTPSGNHTDYYFKVDQSAPPSGTDITFQAANPPCATSRYACIRPGYPNGVYGNGQGGGGPYFDNLMSNVLKLPPTGAGAVVAHELGHMIGDEETNSCKSIENGYKSGGEIITTDVQPNDVIQSHANLTNRTANCTATYNNPSITEYGGSGNCTASPPNASCTCINGSWSCPETCTGTAPNDTCSCDLTGQWNCDCAGSAPICSDGYEAVCYNGVWDCGSVSVSSCFGTAPTCTDGPNQYPADCVNDQWTCPTCP